MPGRHSRSLGRRSGRRRIAPVCVSTTHTSPVPAERDPPAVGCPDPARVGVEAVEDVEAVEGDHGRGARRAVQADRDDHEFGVADRGVRRTGQPAEQQPRSVRRPRRARLVGRVRSGYLEPAGVLARPDEVDVATAG